MQKHVSVRPQCKAYGSDGLPQFWLDYSHFGPIDVAIELAIWLFGYLAIWLYPVCWAACNLHSLLDESNALFSMAF